MFRELRRVKQLLPMEQNIEVLNRNTSGVLAIQGEDNYPYALPINYLYLDNKIIIHTGKQGYKIDMLKNNPKVSFCVIDQDKIVSEEYTSHFRSVIIFGRAKILESKEDIIKSISSFTKRFSPDDVQNRLDKNNIEKFLNNLTIIEIEIEHITGKESSHFWKMREKMKGKELI